MIVPSDDWREELDEYNERQAEHFDLIDKGRHEAFERALLSDEAARNRRLLDDEERRHDGVFDRDRELRDDDGAFRVDWPLS